MIDLHCHSACSDGVLSPTALVAAAAALGLTAVALTDHDTVDGIDEFLAAGHGGAMTLVPGVEIACRGLNQGIMHIVALWIDHHNDDIRDLLHEIRQFRHARNQQMLQRLQELECRLDWEDIESEAQGTVIGRPHFARALVRNGHCRDQKDAFTRFLGRGKDAYVSRHIPDVEEVLPMLDRMGAVSIWAHPLMSSSITWAKLRRMCRDMLPLGLDGIETHYSEYTPHQTQTANHQAKHLGLLASGGSDFHGENIPGIDIGVGRGSLAVPDSLLAPLAARAAEKRQRQQLPMPN